MAARVDVVITQLGESVSEGEILCWRHEDGDAVALDEILLDLETDKTTIELPSPAAGVLTIVKAKGSVVQVGEVIAHIDPAGAAKAETPKRSAAASIEAPGAAATSVSANAANPLPVAPASSGPVAESAAAPSRLGPAARRLAEEKGIAASGVVGTGPGGRATKADVTAAAEAKAQAAATPPPPAPPMPAPAPRDAVAQTGEAGEERVRLTRLRRTIADRLVAAQHTAAILTTFNEVDMSGAMELRARHKDRFAKTHGVSLGFMSIFARACVLALREVPVVGARIDDDDVVYSKHVHLGIAASTERGLVVPVVRGAERMTLADLEREIARLAGLARDGKLDVSDLSGGTFTISNGGVFGSLLSTPILNPPQSGILGMHKIEKRPVVVDDQIVIRPMMYLALSYDHRIVDGREAVTFLVRVKERIEDPSRLLLEV